MKQRDTARAVYHAEIKPTLHGRQLFVRQQLTWFVRKFEIYPTALELVRFIASQYPHRWVDVNTVRPRISELVEQGWVQACGKRECSVSRKRVYVWRPSEPHIAFPEPTPQRLFT